MKHAEQIHTSQRVNPSLTQHFSHICSNILSITYLKSWLVGFAVVCICVLHLLPLAAWCQQFSTVSGSKQQKKIIFWNELPSDASYKLPKLDREEL